MCERVKIILTDAFRQRYNISLRMYDDIKLTVATDLYREVMRPLWFEM